MSIPATFEAPTRLLLGPGPSNAAPEVLKALSQPLVGHLDPAFLGLMEDIKGMLRTVFGTRNELTIPISGTGSAGMEFCLVNLIEPGDEVIIGVNGVFGTRMAEVASRCGAKVHQVEVPWGRELDAQAVREKLEECPLPKLIGVVHAETSTGALTPIDPIAQVARECGALLLVDTVTSLAGCPVTMDEWGADASYSGTQKCLSCPPGLSPVTLSPRALQVAQGRKTKVQSWYLDVNLLASYWGEQRVYHHTAPISMNYALHAALRRVLEEGLEARFDRHEQAHLALKRGLAAMGLEIVSQEGCQLWQLNAVGVPEGVDEALVRKRLLQDFDIEVGPGLGPLKGKIWRVGLMGENARIPKVRAFLSALGAILNDTGRDTDLEAALAATQG